MAGVLPTTSMGNPFDIVNNPLSTATWNAVFSYKRAYTAYYESDIPRGFNADMEVNFSTGKITSYYISTGTNRYAQQPVSVRVRADFDNRGYVNGTFDFIAKSPRYSFEGKVQGLIGEQGIVAAMHGNTGSSSYINGLAGGFIARPPAE